jgi:hypothetical protein
MKTRSRIILIGVIVFGLGTLIFRPVPIPDEKDCLALKGTVTEIYEGGIKDVVFKLQGIEKEFYVNRGLERGLDLTQLRAELTNREIVIKYPQYWTPLDPLNLGRHISKIECDGRVVFTKVD